MPKDNMTWYVKSCRIINLPYRTLTDFSSKCQVFFFKKIKKNMKANINAEES